MNTPDPRELLQQSITNSVVQQKEDDHRRSLTALITQTATDIWNDYDKIEAFCLRNNCTVDVSVAASLLGTRLQPDMIRSAVLRTVANVMLRTEQRFGRHHDVEIFNTLNGDPVLVLRPARAPRNNDWEPQEIR